MKRTAILILVLIAAMAIPALAANGNATGQNSQSIMQTASQSAQAAGNNNAINQNIGQTANQAAYGQSGNAGTNGTIGTTGTTSTVTAGNVPGTSNNTGTVGSTDSSQSIGQNANQSVFGSMGNGSVNQGITQSAGQYANGTGVNQNIGQNANQTVTWSLENYSNTTGTTPLTSEERTLMGARAGQFFTNYPTMRSYIMPLSDINRFNSQNNGNLYVVYVGQNAWNRPNRISGATFIPLTTLVNRFGELPTNKPIVIIGDNGIDAASAMTVLRMNGYNAWIAGGNNPGSIYNGV
ncbi:MAG: rhodanese-like domain-containing protein [Methanotrichaceae archaeon]